ncbi:MAG: CDP-alcohol phosphatidyltransferase family protein [Bacteroidaceae bacterium]|jgi:phosphatidylglycerophosphate synthase|nr:CDP-alcohol phosphatidyltransferase family protein [Bacteroidaceae bacterium]
MTDNKKDKTGYLASLKSVETEDWLDFHLVRPFCYHLARFLAKFGIHPNTVTIWSIIIGAGSCVFFAHGSFYYEGVRGLVLNLIAVFLLCWADIFDCTDGQLARLTGQKSRLGRILDGVAGFIWYMFIYVAIAYRFYLHHGLEFGWFGIENTAENTMIATCVVVALGLYSGFVCMAGQTRLADYYIQVHLFFLKGAKGSEFDNSKKQQEIYEQTSWKGNWVWKAFLNSYVGYTRKQEKATPQFQRMMKLMKEKYGSVEQVPSAIRQEFHDQSLALMKWNGLLTFNFRSAIFFLACLLDVPVMNFIFEIVVMSLLAWYINHRHESFSKQIAQKL